MTGVLLLQCPACKHRMKFLPIKSGTLSSARKKCVYCGKGIRVKEAIVSVPSS